MTEKEHNKDKQRTKYNVVSVKFIEELEKNKNLNLSLSAGLIEGIAQLKETLVNLRKSDAKNTDVLVLEQSLNTIIENLKKIEGAEDVQNFIKEITRFTGIFENAVIHNRISPSSLANGGFIAAQALRAGTAVRNAMIDGRDLFPFERIAREFDDFLNMSDVDQKIKIEKVIKYTQDPINGIAKQLYETYNVDPSPIYGLIAVYVGVSAALSLTSFVSGGLPKDFMSFMGSLMIACIALYFLYTHQMKLRKAATAQ